MFDFKKIFITLSLASLIFLIPLPTYAAGGEGGYAGAYLRIGVGARPLGMGGAFIALADDATASYWNPAGLGQIETSQLACMYSLMSMDRMLNLASYAQPDIEKNAKQDAKYHIGVEYWFKPSIAARIGYNRNHVTAGGSAIFPISSVNIQLDYAFSPDVLQQWPTHRMSMIVKF